MKKKQKEEIKEKKPVLWSHPSSPSISHIKNLEAYLNPKLYFFPIRSLSWPCLLYYWNIHQIWLSITINSATIHRQTPFSFDWTIAIVLTFLLNSYPSPIIYSPNRNQIKNYSSLQIFQCFFHLFQNFPPVVLSALPH